MKITRGIENAEFVTPTIATLGSYDGIHLGHRAILETLIRQKNERGYKRSVVLTFDPHPQEVLKRNNSSVELLTTIDERLRLLSEIGIDETIIIKFSFEFSQTPYSDFFTNTLVKKIGIGAMVVGDNHAFGKNREGDIAHLELLAQSSGVNLIEAPPYLIDGVHISSTKIRHLLEQGNVQQVAEYLGRDYEVSGIVVGGDKLGRSLGYPTANIQTPSNKLIPRDGVYAGKVIVGTDVFIGAISIGSRPTVTDSKERVLEALLLDFAGDIYGTELQVQLRHYLREQIAFPTLEALQSQMGLDVQQIRAMKY